MTTSANERQFYADVTRARIALERIADALELAQAPAQCEWCGDEPVTVRQFITLGPGRPVLAWIGEHCRRPPEPPEQAPDAHLDDVGD